MGEITFDGTSPIVYDVSATTGERMFVALASTDTVTGALTEKWWHYISSNNLGLAVKTNATNSLIKGTYFVYVGTEEKTPLTSVTDRVYQKKENSKAKQDKALTDGFNAFAAYGLTYDAESDRLYYGGKRVKLFVSFRQNGAFDLCWSDANASSGLYLEGMIDKNRKATGIRILDVNIAEDILSDMEEARAFHDDAKESSNSSAVKFRTFDATSIYGADEIVATDKNMTKSSVPENVRQWIARCDQQTGAFLLRQNGENGHSTFYLYYNGGGRYPWNLAVKGDTVTFNLYTDQASASEGYHLMKIDTVGSWNIAAALDDAPLPFQNQ